MMYIVHADNNRIVTEEQLEKEYYESERNEFKSLPFDEWLLECIDRGFISFAN